MVQQTFLDAVRGAGQSRGRCKAELVGWLDRLLACDLADVRRAKRDRSRELSLERPDGTTRLAVETLLGRDGSLPSGPILGRESEAQVAAALARLAAANRRDVTLRHLKGRSIAEIANLLGRSPAAVAGLLNRGLAEVRLAVRVEAGPSREDEIR